MRKCTRFKSHRILLFGKIFLNPPMCEILNKFYWAFNMKRPQLDKCALPNSRRFVEYVKFKFLIWENIESWICIFKKKEIISSMALEQNVCIISVLCSWSSWTHIDNVLVPPSGATYFARYRVQALDIKRLLLPCQMFIVIAT